MTWPSSSTDSPRNPTGSAAVPRHTTRCNSLGPSRPTCAGGHSGSVRPSTPSAHGNSGRGCGPTGSPRWSSGPELVTGGIAELAEDDERAALAARAHDPTKNVERERKFLVSNIPSLPDEGVALRQGYLAIDGSVSARVRDAGTEGCTLTVKAGRGGVRTELEWPLTRDEFEAAWQQTGGRRVHKTRYRLEYGEHLIELDVFHEELDGLVVAEVEFDSEQSLDAFQPPEWFGREVTEDERYTNAVARHQRPTGPARRLLTTGQELGGSRSVQASGATSALTWKRRPVTSVGSMRTKSGLSDCTQGNRGRSSAR